jgi:hypothetical protein
MFYYFIDTSYNNTPLTIKWFTKLKSNKQVTISDKLYNTICCVSVNIKIKYILYTAKVEQELDAQKTYNVFNISPNITFYFDKEYGFIESKFDNPDLIIDIYNKLLTNTSYKPFIFFDNLSYT